MITTIRALGNILTYDDATHRASWDHPPRVDNGELSSGWFPCKWNGEGFQTRAATPDARWFNIGDGFSTWHTANLEYKKLMDEVDKVLLGSNET